ncbi:MAG: GTP-binding protein [Alphaproteobacteria bacterium]|nr:GTP-binding protein [Alphaproteobacteria bacterium]
MSASSDPRQRIPVTLVTGFLGSGKTTLINAGLKSPELSRTVVVVNEFGEVGLDHQLYTSSNDAVIVLENGCLCCTVRSDLVSTLNNLFHDRQAGRLPDFNNVVIETTGLAEPGPVIQAFLSEPTLDGLYRVANVITVVDAVNWHATAESHDEAVRQVALADTILVSKLDLAENVEVDALFADLRAINPAAEIAKIDYALPAVAPLLMQGGFDAANPKADPTNWLSLASYDAYSGNLRQPDAVADQPMPGHLAARGIESFVLTRSKPLSREELQFLLDGIQQNLGPSLLRVKGLVNISDEPGKPAVIQGAQHLLHSMTWLDTWPSADQRTRIVFITQGIARERLKEMIELLDRMSERTFAAREKARLARLAAAQENGKVA